MNFDALRYIGAVKREIYSRVHEGRPARVLVASCAYDTTQSDLWDGTFGLEGTISLREMQVGRSQIANRHAL